MDLEALRYALAKKVPDLRHGLTLHTGYGPLILLGDDAIKVAALVEKLLHARLKQAEREARKG
jgi:hypothetical protein